MDVEDLTPPKKVYYLPKLTKWGIVVLRKILNYDFKQIK